MNKALCLLLIFTVQLGYSQKKYRKFREQLAGLTCKDKHPVEHAKTNIPLLEKYIAQHPNYYDAYYDLAMSYFSLLADSNSRAVYAQKAIDANLHYLQLAPQKMKYLAHWNNAIIKSGLKDCIGAIEELDAAKQLYKLRKKYWDGESEKEIRGKCSLQSFTTQNKKLQTG